MERVKNLTKANTLAPKPRSKRAELLSMISDVMRDKVYESALEKDAYGEFEFPSGWVEITMMRNGEVEVAVVHHNEHESPALEKAIGDCLPDWSEVEAEAEKDAREEQEFRDYLWRNCVYW